MLHRRPGPLRGLILALALALLAPLASTTAASASDAATEATSPSTGLASAVLPAAFTPPPEWSSICDSVGKKGTPFVRGTNCRYLKLDGVFRHWIVDVPRSSAFPMDRKWPVVMVIHGSSASGERIREKTNWPAVTEQVGAIGVYPTAWRYYRLVNHIVVTRWNSYTLKSEIDLKRRYDGYPRSSPYPARDMLFIKKVMNDLGSLMTLDPRHIHATGGSQGGRFIPRMAVEMADTFASVSCEGWCDAPPRRVVVPRRVSILYSIGSIDDLVLKYLQQTRPGLQSIPTTWPEAWKVLKPLLRGHLRAWDLPTDPKKVNRTGIGLNMQWRAANSSPSWITRFKVMVLSGLGHDYPAPWTNPGGLDLAEMSWQFFRDNPMPGGGS